MRKNDKVKKQSQLSQVKRDFNIQKCSTGELNLVTRTVQDKTKYSRKEKHRAKFF